LVLSTEPIPLWSRPGALQRRGGHFSLCKARSTSFIGRKKCGICGEFVKGNPVSEGHECQAEMGFRVTFPGPFEHHDVVVDGWRVPFLQAHMPAEDKVTSTTLTPRT
jgi:hypothetical protein